jgi:hypothetical protein
MRAYLIYRTVAVPRPGPYRPRQVIGSGFFIYLMPKKDLKVMPLTYKFKCSNGHEFDAVAKLRSTCPECGKMTFRRGGSSSGTTTTQKLIAGENKIDPPSTHSLQGEDKPPVSDTGSKPVLSLKKPDVGLKLEKSTPSAKIVRQGRVPPPVKKPISVVKKKIAPVHHIPSVTRKPEGSRQHKVEDMPSKSYGASMMEKHFFSIGKKPR